MMVDRYRTLQGESEGLYREKASRFLAWAFPIADESAFKERTDAIAKEHHASRHVCYAWILGPDGQHYRANDAGEPAGTAGRPILRQLQALQLAYAAVVVVRYFGGTLLGKAGLVHAYGEAAREALAHATIVERVITRDVHLRCSYAQVEELRTEVARGGGSVVHATYGEPCALILAVPLGSADAFIARWRLRGITVDQGK
jgi:uncharacterized YigZ family protein